jgi:xanthine/uracil permease
LNHQTGRQRAGGALKLIINRIKTKIMKNLFAAILVALTVSTASVSFAATTTTDNPQTAGVATPAVTFAQIEKSKLDVTVVNITDEPVIVRLFDSFGKNIASKNISKSETGTRVRFDLSSLADGVYHVKATTGKDTQVQRFELKTTAPAITTYKDVAIL